MTFDASVTIRAHGVVRPAGPTRQASCRGSILYEDAGPPYLGGAPKASARSQGMSRRLLKFSGGFVDVSHYATFSSAMRSPSC